KACWVSIASPWRGSSPRWQHRAAIYPEDDEPRERSTARPRVGHGHRPERRCRPPRGRAPLAGGRGAPLALPPGPDPGPKDGQGDDLLAGALRLHAHQLDPDSPRPFRLREVREARGGLPRRLPGRGDPQDPPDLWP